MTTSHIPQAPDDSPQAAKPFYKATPEFDENTLPAGLRKAHRTAPGTWGIIRVLEGELRYVIEETSLETILSATRPGLVRPEQLHHVEPLGRMRMRVEFYDHEPLLPNATDNP